MVTPFVAARITRILDETQPTTWRYVSTHDNPADILSRSATPDQLPLWWHGPAWFARPESDWPSQPALILSQTDELAVLKETKRTSSSAHAVISLEVRPNSLPPGAPERDEFSIAGASGFFESLLQRRSTLNAVLRVTAHVIRFISRVKQIKQGLIARPTGICNPLPTLIITTASEKEAALQIWVKLAQRQSFAKDIKALQTEDPLPPTSKLRRLTPIWWIPDATLRITGRVSNPDRALDEIHPLILPAEHRLVELLILDAHIRTSHGGPQLCIALLRQRFWILRLRLAVRRFIAKKCVPCIRYSKQAAQQLIGALPTIRTTPAPPFSRVGVDFAGPFTLRKAVATTAASRRAVGEMAREPTTIKGWVVVFVCLVTRAVHLDVTRGLHVESFLDCIAHMTARRHALGTTAEAIPAVLDQLEEGLHRQFANKEQVASKAQEFESRRHGLSS